MDSVKMIFLGFVFLLSSFCLSIIANGVESEECECEHSYLSLGQPILLEKETSGVPFVTAGKVGIVVGVAEVSGNRISYVVRFKKRGMTVDAVVIDRFLRPI